MKTRTSSKAELKCRQILLDLGFSAHHCGYKQLKMGIPQFALDDQQSLASELYPYIVNELNYTDVDAVERSIGRSISFAWNNGNRAEWEKFFPGCDKAPSNKRFIATIAEFIK